MAEKIRIMIIGPTPPPHHGVAMATRMLLDLKMRDLFDLSHVDLADRRGIAHVDQPDLHDVFLFIRQWFTLLWKLLREQPHIVYLPISQTTLGVVRDSLLIWPAFLFGARIVLHLHGGNFRRWYEGRDGLLRFYVRLLLKATTRVVVLGASLKPLFSGLIPESRISVVPNGIEWGKARSGSGKSARKKRFRILYLGTLNRLKGVLVLLSAVPRTLNRRRDVEFVFAGGWSHPNDRREAEALLSQIGAGDHVFFTGPLEGEAKEDLFASADLFVFPGVQQEGQPLVVIEAMAAGLPILFTDRGCLRETVITEENGREVRINDPEDLAEQIVRMLEHPEVMRKMGQRSRARYEANYTAKIFLQRMVVLFLKVGRERR
jgi:glycosyltransferase involved in cell wall biosynthesis